MAVTPCVVCCDVSFISLKVDPSYATLKHDADINIELTVYPSGASYSNVRIEARRYDEDTGIYGPGAWCTLAEGADVKKFRAKIAGFFQIRAIATVCGVEHISDTTEYIVQFPTYDQIVADPDVQVLMESLWEETVRLSSTALSWRELATFIRLDTSTELYDGDRLLYGPEFKPGFDRVNIPKIELPDPVDNPVDPSPCASGADYYVADFHTHPPATFVPTPDGSPQHEYQMEVGPSELDKRTSYIFQLPGIVYDQLSNVMLPVGGSPVTAPSRGNVRLGTPLDAPAGPYHTLRSVDRRPTPEYHSGAE